MSDAQIFWDTCKNFTNYMSDRVLFSASVSCVKTGDTSERGISGSYDKCLIIWDFKKGKSLATLKGHKEAVIDFVST